MLGHTERSLVSELRDVRNKWAHQRTFTTDDAYRALDSMERLLNAVSAPKETEEIARHKAELLRVKFDEQARHERRKVAATVLEGQTVAGLRPWRECSIHDSAPERTWRHLDTMQFETLIRARTPRSECPEHGVKTMTVPWAAPQGRFTLHFEGFAIEVLLACASVSQACEWLGIGWESAHEIMKRAVERGLERRQLDHLKYLGLDEKSFKRGHSYISLLTDLEESRVLDVVEERTAEAADQLWEGLSPEQKQTVEAVAVDLWEPFIQTIQKQVPEADIVHDKFHVSKYLGEAVDKVRRQEHKELMAEATKRSRARGNCGCITRRISARNKPANFPR